MVRIGYSLAHGRSFSGHGRGKGAGVPDDEVFSSPTAVTDKYDDVPDGHYTYDFNGTQTDGFTIFDDSTFGYGSGSGWLLWANYVHKGGTDVPPSARTSTDGLPTFGSDTLGTDENGTAHWGHADNAFIDTIASAINATELLFYARTSNHNRVIHFRTDAPDVMNYVRTGTGDMQPQIGDTTYLTKESKHTAYLPESGSGSFIDEGNYAVTNFPFYNGGSYHWGVGVTGQNPHRWEVDDYPADSSNDTIHRVFIR